MRVVAELDSLFIVHAESAAAMANIPEVHIATTPTPRLPPSRN